MFLQYILLKKNYFKGINKIYARELALKKKKKNENIL